MFKDSAAVKKLIEKMRKAITEENLTFYPAIPPQTKITKAVLVSQYACLEGLAFHCHNNLEGIEYRNFKNSLDLLFDSQLNEFVQYVREYLSPNPKFFTYGVYLDQQNRVRFLLQRNCETDACFDSDGRLAPYIEEVIEFSYNENRFVINYYDLNILEYENSKKVRRYDKTKQTGSTPKIRKKTKDSEFFIFRNNIPVKLKNEYGDAVMDITRS